MNPLESILQSLFAQAQPRPDIGSPQPVATFAGRIAHQGESPQQVLQRMPMGSGEGDLPSALQATMGALAQPALQGAAGIAAKALLPKLAMMVAGGRFFHGTPDSPIGPLTPDFSGSRSGGAVGPGLYLSNNPEVTSGAPQPGQPLSYAFGGTSGATADRPAPAPQTHPFLVKNHNALVTDKPFSQPDMNALIASLQQGLGASQPGSFQKGGTANRAANVVAEVRPQVGQEGQQIWDTLNRALGPDRTNQVLKNAGFQSIQYPGGDITGSALKHQAMNVLDPSIMQNLFDALVGKAQPPS